MPRLVVDLADARPIFALPPALPAELRAAAGDDWDVEVVEAPATGTGDGGGRASPAALEAVRDAEVYFGFGVPPEILRAGHSLRWVHSGAAGVGGSLSPEMVESDVIFTNSAGIHGPPVAETVLAFLLYFARGFDVAAAAQREREWRKDAFDSADAPVRELAGSVVGVVGLGGIGREVAARSRALGARVVATRRSDAPSELAEVLIGPDALERLLELCHYVVLTLPETRETRGLMGRHRIARMRPDAVLVNVARGGLVDESALVEALERGRLRGAGLDVFATEPLPSGHPLWSAPNTLITPHTSAYSHRFWAREAELLLDNLRRYRRGERLRNVVDKAAGY